GKRPKFLLDLILEANPSFGYNSFADTVGTVAGRRRSIREDTSSEPAPNLLKYQSKLLVKAGMGNRQPRRLDETLRVSDAAVHRLNGSWWAQYATYGRLDVVEYGT
ncbi:2309_t:CDS:2, partial [Gigaspora rosea]